MTEDDGTRWKLVTLKMPHALADSIAEIAEATDGNQSELMRSGIKRELAARREQIRRGKWKKASPGG